MAGQMNLKHENDKLRKIVIQGWGGMLFLLFLMMLTDLVEFGMKGDFSALNKDPGVAGLWFIVIMTCVNVLTQMSLQVFDARLSRWAFFYMTSFYTLTIVGYQINH